MTSSLPSPTSDGDRRRGLPSPTSHGRVRTLAALGLALAVGVTGVVGVQQLASAPSDDPVSASVEHDDDHHDEGGDHVDDASAGVSSSDDHATQGHANHGSSTDAANHAAATALVDPSTVTHTAVASGPWNDATTWADGRMPSAGSRVSIPTGIVVTVDGIVEAAAKTIGIEGTLRFATDVDTLLPVDTLVSHPTGRLEVGTPEQPIAADVTARIVFTDDGPIDRQWDPTLLSRGAILHGSTVMYGADTTHRSTVATFPRAGDQTVELSAAPTGWRVGDEFVITGTNGATSDELRTITSIDGARISLDRPLDLDHVPPAADLDLYVANLTRNIHISSENSDIDRRGHMMVMHTLDAQLHGVRFADMGRTDKSRELDDWEFDDIDPGAVGWSGEANALGGTNVRGRYTLHFHRGGADPSLTPATVTGSVVTGDPGWAFTNHSSHVDFVRNVAYDNVGAGFFTEAGDEVGRWVDNIAIRTVMPNFRFGDEGAIDPDIRADRQDFGIDGDGFWLQGNRMDLIGNVSAGSTGHGLIWWSEALAEADLGRVSTVRVSTLDNASLLPDRSDIPVWWAPLGEVRDNVAYGSTIGFRSRYVHGASYLEDPTRLPQAYIDSLQPVFDGMTTWDVRDGVLMNYNERLTLRNIRAIGRAEPFDHNFGHTAAIGVGVDVGNDATFGPGRIEDINISGFEVGLIGPRHGAWTIDDATIAATTDVLLHAPEHTERALDMTDLTFAPLNGTPLEESTIERRNVVLAYEYAGDGDGVDPTTAEDAEFDAGFVRADSVTWDGRGLYSHGLPSDQLPDDATTDERLVNGFIGSPAPAPEITHVPGAGALGGGDDVDEDEGDDEGDDEDFDNDVDEDELDDSDEPDADEIDDRDHSDREDGEFDDDALDRIETVLAVIEGEADLDDVDDDVRERVLAIIDGLRQEDGDPFDQVIDALDQLLDREDLDGSECPAPTAASLEEELRCAILGTS